MTAATGGPGRHGHQSRNDTGGAQHSADRAPTETFAYRAVLRERREAHADFAGRMAVLRVLAQRSRSAGDAAAADLRALVRAVRAGDPGACTAFLRQQRSLMPVVALLRRVEVVDRPAMALARAEVLRAPARLLTGDVRTELADLAAAVALDAELVGVYRHGRAVAHLHPEEGSQPLPDVRVVRDLLWAARAVAEAEDRTATAADPAVDTARDTARTAARAWYVPTAADRATARRAAGEAIGHAGGRGFTAEQEYQVGQAARTAAERVYQAARDLVEPVAAARGTLAALWRLSRVPGLAESLAGVSAADRHAAAGAVATLIATANTTVVDTVPFEAAWLLSETLVGWPDGYLMSTDEANAISLAYQASYTATREAVADRSDVVAAAEAEAREAVDRQIALLRGVVAADPEPRTDAREPARANGLAAGRLAYLSALSDVLSRADRSAPADHEGAPDQVGHSPLARLMREAASRRWTGTRLAAAREATGAAQRAARDAEAAAQAAGTGLEDASASLRHAEKAHSSAQATLEQARKAQVAAAEYVEAQARAHDAATRSAAQPSTRPGWGWHFARRGSGNAAVRAAQAAYTAAVTAHIGATQALHAALAALSSTAAARRAAQQAHWRVRTEMDRAEAAARSVREMAETSGASLDGERDPAQRDRLSVADAAAMDDLVSEVVAAHAEMRDGAMPAATRSSTDPATIRFVARMRAAAHLREQLPADAARQAYLAARDAAVDDIARPAAVEAHYVPLDGVVLDAIVSGSADTDRQPSPGIQLRVATQLAADYPATAALHLATAGPEVTAERAAILIAGFNGKIAAANRLIEDSDARLGSAGSAAAHGRAVTELTAARASMAAAEAGIVSVLAQQRYTAILRMIVGHLGAGRQQPVTLSFGAGTATRPDASSREIRVDGAGVHDYEAVLDAFREPSARVVAARRTPEASVGALLATATAAMAQRWRLAARTRADAARTVAQQSADPAQGVAHWREYVMFTAFPLLAGASGWLPGELRPPDFLALVQRLLGPQLTEVRPADLARIDGYIRQLRDAGRPVDIDGLLRRRAFELLRDGLESGGAAAEALASREAAAVESVVGPGRGGPASTTNERHWEVRGLLRSLNDRDGTTERLAEGLRNNRAGDVDAELSHRARVLDHLVGRVYQRYPRRHHGAALVEPVGLDQIGELVTDKLGPTASLTWTELQRVHDSDAARRKWLTSSVVGRVVSAGRRMTGQPALARRLRPMRVYGRVARWQVRQIQRSAGMPDAREQVRAEVRQVWDHVRPVAGSDPALGSLTEADVARLVAARRELFAAVGNRQFTDLSDYRAMTLLASGTPEVTAERLAQLTARLRDSLAASGPSRPTLAAAMARLVTASWSEDKAGARPGVPGITTDHSDLVSAFHTIVDLPFTAELTAWLNGIVPLSQDALSEDTVRRKLLSLFGQALDDGVELTVQAGVRKYAVRLWPVAVAPPKVQDASLIPAGAPGSGQFPGKGENRIYPYDEAANTEAISTGLFGDVGVVGQAGAGSTKLVGALTGGLARSSGRLRLASVQRAIYQFLRIKEPLGVVNLRTAWVARVLDTHTNRWRDFVWTDRRGTPVVKTLAYAVASFALPLSAEQAGLHGTGTPQAALAPPADPPASGAVGSAAMGKIDPEYLVELLDSPDKTLPLWDFDHGVSRVMLADAVLAELRRILSREDYAFWRPVLEVYISNDRMANGLADILRPPRQAGFQKVYRVMLRRNGRHLSLSLSPQGDRPISSVMKISEISRSGETRFDRVWAVVVKSVVGHTVNDSPRLTQNLQGFGGVFQIRLRATRMLRRGREYARASRSWLTRAKRTGGATGDRITTVKVAFSVRVDVHHEKTSTALRKPPRGRPAVRVLVRDAGGRQPHLRRVLTKRPVLTAQLRQEVTSDCGRADGYAHVMLPARTLRALGLSTRPAKREVDADFDRAEDTRRERDALPDPNKRWWSLGHGLSLDFVENLDGVAGLYNDIVAFMVVRGYLPRAATPSPGQHRDGHDVTAWDLLQDLVAPGATVAQRTGGVLNRPGQDYANWRKLVTALSERWLIPRIDDLTVDDPHDLPGVVLSFPKPRQGIRQAVKPSLRRARRLMARPRRILGRPDDLTIGLALAIDQDRQEHLGTHPHTVQVGHTHIDTVAGARVRGHANDIGVVGGFDIPGGDSTEAARLPVFGQVRYSATHHKAGHNQSTALSSDTDGQDLPSARYRLGVVWTWQALPGNEPATEVHGAITVLQPDEWHVTADTAVPPELDWNVPAHPESVLSASKIVIYTVLGVKGLGALQHGLDDGGVPITDVLRDVSGAVYRSVALRGLATAATLPVGLTEVALSITPLGRPQILRVWKPYTQQILEAQAGAQSSGEYTEISGAQAPAAAVIPVGEDTSVLPEATGTAALGSARLSNDLDTVGSYRALYQDAPFALIRTVVET